MSRIVIVGFILVLNGLYATLSASERLPTLPLAMDGDPRLAAPAVQYGLPGDWAVLWKNALMGLTRKEACWLDLLTRRKRRFSSVHVATPPWSELPGSD